MCLESIYLIYTYEEGLSLDKLQGLICHKTQTNPTKPNHMYLIYMYKEDLALNNLGSCPNFPYSKTPTIIDLQVIWPCVKSCLVGGRDKYHLYI